MTGQLAEVAARNLTRRRIRFPALYGLPPVAAAYAALHRLEMRAVYQYILGKLHCDTTRTVLIFNGYLAPNALLALAAQTLSMRCLYLENGFFPETMQCDPAGINALSTLPRDAAFYDGLSEADCGDGRPKSFVVRRSKLKDGGAAGASRTLPERYVFVPFQVPSDMQILALSPWIRDMIHLYEEIAALAEAFPERHFVIKEHPSFPLSVQGRVRAHPRIHFANGAVTSDLIEGAAAIITVNSTVGLEALTLDRKVVTLGEAHYNIDGLVLHATDRTALRDAFARLDMWQPDAARRERYIRFVYNRFLIPLSRERPGPDAERIIGRRAAGDDAYMRALAQWNRRTAGDETMHAAPRSSA